MTVCLRAARRVWQADAIGDATLQFHIYALNESSSQEEVDRARIRAYAQLSGGRAGGCAEWDGQRSEGGGGVGAPMMIVAACFRVEDGTAGKRPWQHMSSRRMRYIRRRRL